MFASWDILGWSFSYLYRVTGYIQHGPSIKHWQIHSLNAWNLVPKFIQTFVQQGDKVSSNTGRSDWQLPLCKPTLNITFFQADSHLHIVDFSASYLFTKMYLILHAEMTISRNFHLEPWKQPERGIKFRNEGCIGCIEPSWICWVAEDIPQSHMCLCPNILDFQASVVPKWGNFSVLVPSAAGHLHPCGRYVQEKEAQHDVRDALQATGWVVYCMQDLHL